MCTIVKMARTKYSSQLVQEHLSDWSKSWTLRFKDTTSLEEVDELLAEAVRWEHALVEFDLVSARASVSKNGTESGYFLSLCAPVLSGEAVALPPGSLRDNIVTQAPEVFEDVVLDGGLNESMLQKTAAARLAAWKWYLEGWAKGVNADITKLNEWVRAWAPEEAKRQQAEIAKLDRVNAALRGADTLE